MGITHKSQYVCHTYFIIFMVILLKFKRIRDLREDKDIKQRQIAEYLSINQSTYSDYETGRTTISVEALIKLADYYGVTLDYLVGRED